MINLFQYKQLDNEHVGLFDAMYNLEQNLGDQGLVDTLQELLRDHFYYEEKQFCDALDLPWDYCKEHKKKHVLFSAKFDAVTAPVSLEDIKVNSKSKSQ